MINTILVLAYVAGAASLGIAALRYLEDRKDAPVSRLVLLIVVVVALFSAIEAASSHEAQRPWSVLLIMIVGVVAVWKAFMPPGACFTDLALFCHRRPPPPTGGIIPPA